MLVHALAEGELGREGEGGGLGEGLHGYVGGCLGLGGGLGGLDEAGHGGGEVVMQGSSRISPITCYLTTMVEYRQCPQLHQPCGLVQ